MGIFNNENSGLYSLMNKGWPSGEPIVCSSKSTNSKEKNHANKSSKTATQLQGNISYTLGKIHMEFELETSRLQVAEQNTQGR